MNEKIKNEVSSNREKIFETIAMNPEDAVAKVQENPSLNFPILVVPWGVENSGANQYVVNNYGELESAVEEALNDALYEGKVHLITKEGQGEFWNTSGTLKDPLTDNVFKGE